MSIVRWRCAVHPAAVISNFFRNYPFYYFTPFNNCFARLSFGNAWYSLLFSVLLVSVVSVSSFLCHLTHCFRVVSNLLEALNAFPFALLHCYAHSYYAYFLYMLMVRNNVLVFAWHGCCQFISLIVGVLRV